MLQASGQSQREVNQLCSRVSQAQESCMLQLDLLHVLHISIETETAHSQHWAHQSKTQSIGKEEALKILLGQAQIQRALDVTSLSDRERLRLAVEAWQALNTAKAGRSLTSQQFLLQQVSAAAVHAFCSIV